MTNQLASWREKTKNKGFSSCRFLNEGLVLSQLVELTAAHVGFLHSPDVGATKVTGLHNADLVRAEPVIQRTIKLLSKCANSVQPCNRGKQFKWR